MARLTRGKDVIIVIGADDQSGNVLEKAKIGMKDMTAQAEKSRTSLRDMRYAWMAASAAAAALVGTIIKLTSAYAEQERLERKLRFAIEAQGLEVKKTHAHLLAYAGALQQSSIYGDEAILTTQQLLLQVGQLSGGALDRATQATLDFASVWGMDLTNAATLVAKAATGYTSALTRYGIVVDNTLPDSEKFAQVLEQMETRFGGTARAELDTFAGGISLLKRNMGDLAEEFGRFIASESGILDTAIRKWAQWAKAATEAIAGVRKETSRTEIELVEKMIADLEREMSGARYTIAGTLGEWGGEGMEIIDEPSLERSYEIMSKITRLRERLTFLRESPESPLAEPSGPDGKPHPGETAGPADLSAIFAAYDAQMEADQAFLDQRNETWLAMQDTRLSAEREAEETRILEIEERIARETELEQMKTDALLAMQRIQQQARQADIEQQRMQVEAARAGFEALATMFPQVKALAVGEAIISTYQGVAKALGAYPPPLSYAYAAAVLAKGMAAVRAIQQQGITTGGGTGSYSYGGAQQTVPADQAAAQSPTRITINIPEGSRVYSPQEIAEISILGLKEHLKETGHRIDDIQFNVVTG